VTQGELGRELAASRLQAFDRSTVRDHANAHFGDRHNSIYYGPVHQSGVAVPASVNGAAEYKIKDALKFDGMDWRRATIKLAYGNTCRWFFDSAEHKRWRDDSLLEEHHGFMWIRGKPGAGKSTLMKLAVKDADHRFSDDLKASFFFNARGTSLERSVEGMYRSLLYQLLVQCPELEPILTQRAWDGSSWSVELLEEHFRDCVLQLGKKGLICHIDALDECEESDIRAMVEFLEDLGGIAACSGVRLRICFASRHYPHISISKCVHLILDGVVGHQEDIETYVRNGLKISEPDIRAEFAKEIRARAQDVFLWVVLVVRSLNKESDRGHGHSLRAHLTAIPDGLHNLFEDATLHRGVDDTQYLLPSLLWVLFCRRTLTPLELYHGVMHANGGVFDAKVLDDRPTSSRIERFILNTSKGLIEITARACDDEWEKIDGKEQLSQHAAGQLEVHFVHESVREYLLHTGIGMLDSRVCSNPTGSSHDNLKFRCFQYMICVASILQQIEASASALSKSFRDRPDRICNAFPFLDYAYKASVLHAEAAQAHSLSQASFVEAFPLELLVWINKMIVPSSEDHLRLSPSATKIYVFALFSAPQLLRLELSSLNKSLDRSSRINMVARDMARREVATSPSHGYYGHPLRIAVFNGSLDVVKILLEHGFDANTGSSLDTIPDGADDMMKCHNDDWTSVLETFIGDTAWRLLYDGLPVLHLAVVQGNLEMVRLLIDYGADVNGNGEPYGSPLQVARERGSIQQEVVDLLIERGAHDDV
jgi:hypothetical protein